MAKLSSPATVLVEPAVQTAADPIEDAADPVSWSLAAEGGQLEALPQTTVVDPTSERVVVPRPPAPRLGKLSGKVALIDISKPQGSVLLDRWHSDWHNHYR